MLGPWIVMALQRDEEHAFKVPQIKGDPLHAQQSSTHLVPAERRCAGAWLEPESLLMYVLWYL